MATNTDILERRGHEFYVRYLLLFGKPTPVALKFVIEDIAVKQNKPLDLILEEKKDTLKTYYIESYSTLFEDPKVNTDIDSWNILVLCDVLSVLLGQELDYIQCIRDQWKDLEKYIISASLDYDTFNKKRDSLLDAIHEIIDQKEGEGTFECKRLIHSYDENINVSTGLIRKLKQSTTVNEHIKLSVNSQDNENHIENGDSRDDLVIYCREKTEMSVFPSTLIKGLEDTFVNVNEPAIFVCELSITKKPVEWRKNGEHIAGTDSVKYFSNENTHFLHISRATKEDTGTYTCSSGNVSTSALLKVYEYNLEIIEHLHVVEEDIKEDRGITLTCKVNTEAKKPKWFHNRKDITASSRVLVLSQDREHKLIIHRARVSDGGEYIVAFDRTASTTNNSDLGLRYQLTKKDYRNWVRGALGMKYLKLGLENVSDNVVKKHHDEILKKLQNTKCTKQCNLCNEENLLPCHSKKTCYRMQKKNRCLCSKSSQQRRVCPSERYCSDFYDLIVHGHRYEDPCLSNTNIENWSSDKWSVATCYINASGYKGKTSAREVDCVGILCLFVNNNTYLPFVSSGVFEMARSTRNEILHNANYELSDDKLQEYLDQFKKVLEEVKKDSSACIRANYQYIEASIEELDKLKTHQIEINLADEIQKFKDHAMEEDAEIIEKAHGQKNMELQNLEQKQVEDQLKFLGRLRSAPIKQKSKPLVQMVGSQLRSKEVTLDIKLRIMIYVNGKNDESPKETMKRIYGFVSAELENHNKKTHVTQVDDNNGPTAKAISRLLQPILINKDTLVQEVKNSETHPCVSLKIGCSSVTSLEKLLVAFHGYEFRNCVHVLKKCLEEENEGGTTYDVEASCSSRSMNDLRKELYDRGIFEGITYDFRCEKHDGTQNTWYCSDHDTFCCSSCMEKEHRTCDGLKPVMSNNTFQNETQRRLCIKREIEILGQDSCVKRMCVLPNGEILLYDSYKYSLKKLNSSYKLVSSIRFVGPINNMCYIGNGKAAVLASNICDIEFVNVSGELSVEKRVQLDFTACCLACHGDILYTSDGGTVRVLKTDGTQERFLCNISCNKLEQYMAVSDDGEKIYITGTGGLIVIDNKGNHLSTLKTDELKNPSDLCCIGDGSVLVIDRHSHIILQVDYRGERMLGKVDTRKNKLCPTALCYDRRRSRLVIGSIFEHSIVLELQYADIE